MHTKSVPALVKAAGEADGLAEGQFEALVSVFGNVDWYGDRVMPGAFKDTLADWAQRGDPIPVVWSHRYDDPEYHVGVVLQAEERDDGLWVRGQLDLDDEATKARQVYRLLKGRRVTQFSFSYDVDEAAPAKAAEGEDGSDEPQVLELHKLRLYEVGPTLIGANPDTELFAVKGAAGKAGRVLSARNETTLREALAQIETSAKSIKDVLAQLDDGKAQANEPVKAEDRSSGKAEEPMRCSPADVRFYADLAEVG
jgi:HK97 family phage prohead protease